MHPRLAFALQAAAALPGATASIFISLCWMLWWGGEKSGARKTYRKIAKKREREDALNLQNARNELAMLARVPGRPVSKDLKARVVSLLLGEASKEASTLFDDLNGLSERLREKEEKCDPNREEEYLGNCREWTNLLAQLVTKCDENLPDGNPKHVREHDLLYDEDEFVERYRCLHARILVPNLEKRLKAMELAKVKAEARLRSLLEGQHKEEEKAEEAKS